jgi:prepilin-type N-terminal cleavage/methylation domain-containing protein
MTRLAPGRPPRDAAIGRETGFTLLEVLVAISLFSIGMLALASLQTASIRQNHTARQIGTADQYAIQTIERLLAMEYDAGELDPDGNPHSPPAADPWDATADDGGQYDVSWNVSAIGSAADPVDNIKRVDLSVASSRLTDERSRTYTFLIRPH